MRSDANRPPSQRCKRLKALQPQAYNHALALRASRNDVRAQELRDLSCLLQHLINACNRLAESSGGGRKRLLGATKTLTCVQSARLYNPRELAQRHQPRCSSWPGANMLLVSALSRSVGSAALVRNSASGVLPGCTVGS